MRLLQYLFLFLCITAVLQAQERIEVSFVELNGKVTITYELQSDDEREFEVSVVLKRGTNSSFAFSPGQVSGDIGRGIRADGKHTIKWNLSEGEMNTLDGEDFYFEVTATPLTPANNTNIPIIRNSKWALSFVVPGLGQIMDGSVHGWIAIAAVGGTGLYFLSAMSSHNSDVTAYNKTVTDYQKTPTALNRTIMLDAKTKSDNSYSSSMVALGLFAGAYVLNVVDSYFFRYQPESPVEIKPAIIPVPGSLCYGMNVRVGF